MLTALARLFRPAPAAAARSLDPAGGGRRWADVRSVSSSGTVHAGAATVAARAAHFVLNDPRGACIVETMAANLVGTGIKPRSQHPDETVRARLHRNFSAWTDRADAEGRSDFFGLEHQAARDLVTFGEAPAHGAMTLCANSYGLPWTIDGFSASFRTLRGRLEAAGKVGPDLTLYGLGHTVAVILRELGYADHAIADVLGQEEPRMALRYAKGADLRRNNAATAASFEAELNRRGTKSAKPKIEKRQTSAKASGGAKNV